MTSSRGGAQGHPGVKAAGESGLGDLQQGEGHGQIPGDGLGLGDAQGPAVVVPVGEQGVELVQGLLAGAVGQRQGAQQGDQSGDGVVAPLRPGGVAALRPGGVAALALGVDDGAAVLAGAGEGDAGAGGDIPGEGVHVVEGEPLHRCLSVAGEHVDAEAAVEPLHPGQSLLDGPGAGEGGL